MRLELSQRAWDDIQHWLAADAKLLGRIFSLIEATKRDPFKGIGKPEPLRFKLRGLWSRRITDEHRLIYKVESGVLLIIAC
jgi:toxin YoeB